LWRWPLHVVVRWRSESMRTAKTELLKVIAAEERRQRREEKREKRRQQKELRRRSAMR
jgi:hypothetical protein